MINAVSLFANVGVAETYLKEIGINVVVANELLHQRALFYKHLYPETNMIPFEGKLSDENQNLLNKACMWSLLIKKPNVSDSSGSGNAQDVYMLSRVFSPFFKISYRTRGGFNPIKTLTDYFFSESFNPESILKEKQVKGNKKTVKVKVPGAGMQIPLFDSNDSEDDV